jgi:hypothetical protein
MPGVVQFALCASALGAAAQQRAAPPVARDSAGVHIVSYPENPDDLAPEWFLRDPYLLQIGSVDGSSATRFSGLSHAVRLSDGRIAVANRQPLEVRVFSADGRPLSSFGREGQGPGEFIVITGLRVLTGDTIAVQNHSIGEHLFLPDGTFIRAVPGPWDGLGPTWKPLTGGRVLATVAALSGAGKLATTTYRGSATYWIDSRSERRSDTIGTFAGTQQFRAAGGNLPPLVVPFSGGTHVVASNDMVVVGSATQYELTVYSLGARPSTIIRKAHSPVPLRSAEFELAKEAMRSGALFRALPQIRAQLEAELAAMPMPATHPPLAEVQVDKLGFIWVREARESVPPYRWLVYRRDGSIAGRVSAPSDMAILEIGSNYLLSRWTDSLGVEFLRVHELKRGARQELALPPLSSEIRVTTWRAPRSRRWDSSRDNVRGRASGAAYRKPPRARR